MKREQLNKMLSQILKYAHRLYKESVSNWSEALKLSWGILRSHLYRRHTEIHGASYHQPAIRALSGLCEKDYKLFVKKEPSNQYDSNAQAIYASIRVEDSFLTVKLGYLSRHIVAETGGDKDREKNFKILHSAITGLGRPSGHYLGINITYVVV